MSYPQVELHLTFLKPDGTPASGVAVTLEYYSIPHDAWMAYAPLVTGSSGTLLFQIEHEWTIGLIRFTAIRGSWIYSSPEYPFESASYSILITGAVSLAEFPWAILLGAGAIVVLGGFLKKRRKRTA